MATVTKKWSDGNTTNITYNGNGDETISISSPANEGLDRTMSLTVKTSDGKISRTFTVGQTGRRQYFITKDNLKLCGSGKDAFLGIK